MLHVNTSFTACLLDICVVATFFSDCFIEIKNKFWLFLTDIKSLALVLYSKQCLHSYHSKGIKSHTIASSSRNFFFFFARSRRSSHPLFEILHQMLHYSEFVLLRFVFPHFATTSHSSFITIFYAVLPWEMMQRNYYLQRLLCFFLQMWANICEAIKCIRWLGWEFWVRVRMSSA